MTVLVLKALFLVMSVLTSVDLPHYICTNLHLMLMPLFVM